MHLLNPKMHYLQQILLFRISERLYAIFCTREIQRKYENTSSVFSIVHLLKSRCTHKSFCSEKKRSTHFGLLPIPDMVQPASQHDLPGHEMEACVIRSWVIQISQWEKAGLQGERMKQQPHSRLAEITADLHPSSQAWIWKEDWATPKSSLWNHCWSHSSSFTLLLSQNSYSSCKNGLAAHKTITEPLCFTLEYMRIIALTRIP